MNILKEWQRMCRAMSDEKDDCLRDCPIVGTCPLTTTGKHFTEIDIKDVEQEITKWAKANPLKTCLDDFKEKFPNMRQTMEPWPSIHPWNLGYDVPRDMKAKEAWYLPMEEQARNQNQHGESEPEGTGAASKAGEEGAKACGKRVATGVG